MNSTVTLTDRGVLCGNHKGERIYHGSAEDVRGCFRGNVRDALSANFTPDGMRLDRHWGDMSTVQERQAASLDRARTGSHKMADLVTEILALLDSRTVETRYAESIRAYASGTDFTKPAPTLFGLQTAADRLRLLPAKTAAPAGFKVPAGYYAIEIDGTLKFYKIDVPTEGRWKGYTFVSVQASSDFHQIRAKAAREEILRIIALDPKAAMIAYGKSLGRCGHCHRTLTDENSRAAGIGPVCAAKKGW